MQYYYGEQNILRALDEAEFWKHQEAEHISVIQALTPNLETEYADTLNKFGKGFEDAYGTVIEYIQSIIRAKGNLPEELEYKTMEVIQRCVEQSKKFVGFLSHLLESSHAVKSNKNSQTVIHHIIRESKYFVGIERLMMAR